MKISGASPCLLLESSWPCSAADQLAMNLRPGARKACALLNRQDRSRGRDPQPQKRKFEPPPGSRQRSDRDGPRAGCKAGATAKPPLNTEALGDSTQDMPPVVLIMPPDSRPVMSATPTLRSVLHHRPLMGQVGVAVCGQRSPRARRPALAAQLPPPAPALLPHPSRPNQGLRSQGRTCRGGLRYWIRSCAATAPSSQWRPSFSFHSCALRCPSASTTQVISSSVQTPAMRSCVAISSA